MKHLLFPGLICAVVNFTACAQNTAPNTTETVEPTAYPFVRTPEQWRAELDDQAYYVLREKGTERAFTGEYWNDKSDCIYVCGGCSQELFDSSSKFKSGTGWPSYYEPIADNAIVEIRDASHGMVRVEVVCSNCGGHLGHVFDDGPEPTGLRYCINSASLNKVEK